MDQLLNLLIATDLPKWEGALGCTEALDDWPEELRRRVPVDLHREVESLVWDVAEVGLHDMSAADTVTGAPSSYYAMVRTCDPGVQRTDDPALDAALESFAAFAQPAGPLGASGARARRGIMLCGSEPARTPQAVYDVTIAYVALLHREAFAYDRAARRPGAAKKSPLRAVLRNTPKKVDPAPDIEPDLDAELDCDIDDDDCP